MTNRKQGLRQTNLSVLSPSSDNPPVKRTSLGFTQFEKSETVKVQFLYKGKWYFPSYGFSYSVVVSRMLSD